MRPEESKKHKKMLKLMDAPEVQSWRELTGAFKNVYQELEKAKMEKGIHMSRFQIMLLLYFHGPMSAANLAKKMLVSRGNISTFVKRLESDGHIQVSPESPGPKRPLYMLSEEAIELFEPMFEEHVALLRQLVPPFSPKTRKELSKTGEIRV